MCKVVVLVDSGFDVKSELIMSLIQFSKNSKSRPFVIKDSETWRLESNGCCIDLTDVLYEGRERVSLPEARCWVNGGDDAHARIVIMRLRWT